MGLILDREAEAAIRTLAPPIKQRVRQALRMLDEDAHHEHLDIKPLQWPGETRFWRVRIGSYRIGFSISDGRPRVHRIFHRRDGYGWLERLG